MKVLTKQEKIKFSIALMLLIGMIFFYSVHLVKADLGKVKQGSCFMIRVLSNCSNVNMTEISNSNETFIINKPMTFLGGQTFNYTFCNTSKLDLYSYSWNDPCYDCSDSNCGNTFEVTATGKSFTIEKAITYILIWIVSFIIFIALLILGIALPISNKKDEITGYVLYVSNLKYFKIICLGIAYMVSMFITFFSYNVCFAYLDMDFVTQMFYFIFIFQAILVLPLFIILALVMISNRLNDLRLSEGLTRGLHMK